MRLNKFLSRTGIGSRRACDLYIEKGYIKINGKVIKNFSYQVLNTDAVQFKNKYVEIDYDYKYYILHKPKGYICSKNDEKNRKIIYDLLPSDQRLFSIGRLDYNTTGIVIVTNDGDLSYLLSHPKNNFIKKYIAITDNPLEKDIIKKINSGIKIDNSIMKGKFELLEYKKNIFNWDITMSEGKNREIKRIFGKFNVKVKYLHRYEFAGIKLNDLKIGKFKQLKNNEIRKQFNYEIPKK